MKIDEKLLIGLGVGLIFLSQRSNPMEGLGLSFSGNYKKQRKAMDRLKKDPWIKVGSRRTSVGFRNYRYIPTYDFSPKLNSKYWTIDARALKPKPSTAGGIKGRSGISRFALKLGGDPWKTPIILKAKSLNTLKAAVKSLESTKAKALKYVTKSKPGFIDPGDWRVNAMASRYIKIIEGALNKAKSAIAKAEVKKVEEDKKKAALDALRDATKIPDAGTTPKTPATGPTGPVKNDWQQLIQQSEARRAAAARMPQRPPSQMQVIQQRTAVAPVQKSPDMDVNPVAAGAAAAVPLILAAVL